MQTDLTDQIRDYVETAAPTISLAELAERRGGLGSAARRPRLYPGRPRVLTAGVIAVAMVTAAAVAVITLATGGGAIPGQHSRAAIGGQTATPRFSATAPAARGASAAASISLTAKFLHHAAAIVRAQQGTPPGPEQYVYAETVAEGGGASTRSGSQPMAAGQAWWLPLRVTGRAISNCHHAPLPRARNTCGAAVWRTPATSRSCQSSLRRCGHS